MCYHLDGEGRLRIVDRGEYLSWYDPDNADPELEWETEFYSIDVMERIAAAKLRDALGIAAPIVGSLPGWGSG